LSYKTYYPQVGWRHIPRIGGTLLFKALVPGNQTNRIGTALAISGHSLGAVPVDLNGSLLREATQIWSDVRADREVSEFFRVIDPDEWYITTGNGFPAACYTIFR
jgi:xylulokinase